MQSGKLIALAYNSEAFQQEPETLKSYYMQRKRWAKGNYEVVLSNTTVPCDYVVIAAGYKSRNELAEELSKKYDVKVVGDAASPRRILDATAEAYRVINGL